jgi:hypothetical protein
MIDVVIDAKIKHPPKTELVHGWCRETSVAKALPRWVEISRRRDNVTKNEVAAVAEGLPYIWQMKCATDRLAVSNSKFIAR